jgi:hypothetical protein
MSCGVTGCSASQGPPEVGGEFVHEQFKAYPLILLQVSLEEGSGVAVTVV